jgi:hypothetical protein
MGKYCIHIDAHTFISRRLSILTNAITPYHTHNEHSIIVAAETLLKRISPLVALWVGLILAPDVD